MKKEVVFESIKWSDKSPDEIYQYFSKLNAVEQLRLLKLLCHQYPDIEIDWLDIFEELRFHLSYVDNIAACEEFVQWFPEHHYEEYSRGFEFIERDLCDYYLKIGNLERLRQRIRFISQHPVSGIDTITIRLYFQLLYHGLYEDAINYAEAVAQPIENAEGLWGNPETNFVQGLYLNSLQKAYESYQLTGHAVYSAVFIQAAQLGLEENKKIFDIEQKALTGSLIPAEVLDRVNTEFEHCMIELNVHFLKYMFDNYKIPFMLSEVLWTIVGVKNLFGKSKRIKDFFYVDIKTFETILTKRVDYLLGSNSLEMFGKTWALHYIYEFLEENRLISTEAANQMRENNLYHRNEMICYVGVELWQMSFVFNWPQNHLWSDLQTLFESTYGKSGDESRNILKEFSEMNPPSQRIREEIKSTEPKKHTGKISLKENQTYQKSTPDTGRNDPCPCGSGKKYKNCCLKI